MRESGSAHTASRFARNSLLAPDPRALGIPREKTAECKRWRLSCPRRDALKTLPPPTTTAPYAVRSHATVAWHDLLARLDTMRRMQQHSGATNREHDFASRMVDLFRAVTLAHRHALNPNGLLARRGRPHHERAQTTPM
jgi:hypothetical protein